MKPMARAQQQGAVTLIMVLVLVLLATLASGYSSRDILLGQASSQSLGRAQEARLAAQAALASAEAQLLQTLEAPPDSLDPLTPSITDPFADTALQQARHVAEQAELVLHERVGDDVDVVGHGVGLSSR